MKKLITMLAILVSGMVSAQEFDFTCEAGPAQGQWSHVPQDFTIGNLVYNTTVIGDESDYEYNIIFAHPPGRYRGRNPGGILFTPREGEAFEDGDYIIAKNANTVEGDIIFLGRINGTPISNPNGSWTVDPIQDTEEGAVYASEGPITIGKIADPTHRAWTHTPGDIRILADGNDTTYNTTVIGPEYNFNYAANANELRTGVRLSDWGTGISNGDYFIVKSSDDNFVIIEGQQITAAGVFPVNEARTVYSNNNIFSWATHSGVLTIGKIADPTVVDNDFVHTPGIITVDGYEYNTATVVADEDRFVPGGISQIGAWLLSQPLNGGTELTFTIGVADRTNYRLGEYIVVKQQDATDVDDVWIGEITEEIPSGGINSRIRVSRIHAPSYFLIGLKPIQVGVIADPTPESWDHTPGEIYSPDRTVFYDTTTNGEIRFDFSPQVGPNAWSIRNLDGIQFYVPVGEGSDYSVGEFFVVKQGDTDDANDVWIGEITRIDTNISGAGGAADLIELTPVHTPSSWTLSRDVVIQIGKITASETRVNLRVEIAQPYESAYSGVIQVTIKTDNDSEDTAAGDRIILNDQNNGTPGVWHYFQETHNYSWFNDSTELVLNPVTEGPPRNLSDPTTFTFTPDPNIENGDTQTTKFFYRDSGFEHTSTSLDGEFGNQYFWELDDNQDITGITLETSYGFTVADNSIGVTPLNASSVSDINVGDKVLVVRGDFIIEARVKIITNEGTEISLTRERGHAVSQFRHVNPGQPGATPKMFKLK